MTRSRESRDLLTSCQQARSVSMIGFIKRFLKRFITNLLFLDPDDCMGSLLAWIVVLNGIVAFIEIKRCFQ